METLRKNSDWLKWFLPAATASIVAFSYAMKVPELEQRTHKLETGQAVIERDISHIREGIDDIKNALRGRR